MKKRILSLSLMVLGLVLVIGAVSLFAYNRWDSDRAYTTGMQTASQFMAAIQSSTGAAIQTQAPNADASSPSLDQTAADPIADTGGDVSNAGNVAQSPADTDTATISDKTVAIGGNGYIGVISIPVLNITVPVLADYSLDGLKIGACLYYGSIVGNDAVIAAHDYRRYFGPISDLTYGDEVIFTDASGAQHVYTVAEKTTVGAYDVQTMTQSGYALTLFTCNYGGTARVTVRCVSGS